MSENSKVPRIITADEIKVGQKIAVDRYLRRSDTLRTYTLGDEPEVRSVEGVVTDLGDRDVYIEGIELPVPVRFGPEHTRVIAAEITLLEDAPEPKPVYDPAKHIFVDRGIGNLASNHYAKVLDDHTFIYGAEVVRAVTKAYKEQGGE